MGYSLVAVSRGYSSLQCTGFSLQWLLLLRSTGSRAQAQEFWRTGLVAPRHVRSSQTRARTRVPCIGRRILNHCATREALEGRFLTTGPPGKSQEGIFFKSFVIPALIFLHFVALSVRKQKCFGERGKLNGN